MIKNQYLNLSLFGLGFSFLIRLSNKFELYCSIGLSFFVFLYSFKEILGKYNLEGTRYGFFSTKNDLYKPKLKLVWIDFIPFFFYLVVFILSESILWPKLIQLIK
jgi:hypothetical protein